jgi:hypothetical protein
MVFHAEGSYLGAVVFRKSPPAQSAGQLNACLQRRVTVRRSDHVYLALTPVAKFHHQPHSPLMKTGSAITIDQRRNVSSVPITPAPCQDRLSCQEEEVVASDPCRPKRIRYGLRFPQRKPEAQAFAHCTTSSDRCNGRCRIFRLSIGQQARIFGFPFHYHHEVTPSVIGGNLGCS